MEKHSDLPSICKDVVSSGRDGTTVRCCFLRRETFFLAGRDDQFSLPERYFLTGRYGNFRWKIFSWSGCFLVERVFCPTGRDINFGENYFFRGRDGTAT